jgi:hypothetical protein
MSPAAFEAMSRSRNLPDEKRNLRCRIKGQYRLICALQGSSSRSQRASPCILHREIRPPTPRSEATVYEVTKGNIAKQAATALVALLIVLLSVRTMGYRGEQCSGGEGVSQSPLKDKAFLSFLGKNPPFELRPKLTTRRILRQRPRGRPHGKSVCPKVPRAALDQSPKATISCGS